MAAILFVNVELGEIDMQAVRSAVEELQESED
jgi:hypothetical protein